MKPTHGRVLVVDDDPAMLRSVERILAPGHEARGFSSGEEALRAFREQPFDVAIIDIRMPGMDGFQLTRAIKELRPSTEVILVTGSISDIDEKLVRSVKERAGFFITKPFSRSVLTSLVERCFEIQQLERERDDLIRRLTEDLERARRFQLALLPRGLPRAFGPIQVASSHLSCETVGGDLYDVLPMPGDRLLVMLADVAGHGVAAALVTGMIKAALSHSLQDQAEILPATRAVLDTLAPLGQQRVVTMFIGIIDPKRRTLQYLNAGHPPALVWGPGHEPAQLWATTPLLSHGIGLSRDPEQQHPFGPGDRLVLYSDGLYEVRDPAGREYGRERLLKDMVARRGRIEELVEGVMKGATRHAGGRPQEDDLTILAAEYARS
jgi:sigma-B regulation protein RsbU (phosphoserine phosphatase)